MTGILTAPEEARSGAQPATSVLVTSYRRPDRLAACLDGLRAQTLAPDEVIVVVHATDLAAAGYVAELRSAWPGLRSIALEEHGSVAALNHGLAAARGAIVAVIDDDAVPKSDWLERIATTFERDERIAAVGGRDLVFADGGVVGAPRRRLPASNDPTRDVGRIQWFGRMIGNHHVGVGEARDVDVLKGANMSLRRPAVANLGYDERLRGQGAIVHTEMSICLPLRRRGHRLVYDPSIVVYHYPSPRPHGDHRQDAGFETVLVAAHNEALAILDYFGPRRRLVYSVWWSAVGTTDAPGLVVLVRDLIAGRPSAWMRFRAAQRGRAAAWRTHREPRTVPAPLARPGRGRSPVTVPNAPPSTPPADRDNGATAAGGRRTRFRDNIAVLTDGNLDPGLATLINSLVRNGFDGTLWVGRRGTGSSFLDELPAGVRERIRVRVIELDTPRPLAYFKPDFIEMVWRAVDPDATSVVYMDCDLVLGCDWAFVHAWVATGLALVEDLQGRPVGARHPLRRAWQSVMVAAGTAPAREVGEYFNSGFVGVPAACRPILPLWSALGLALEGLPGVHDPANPPHCIVGVRSPAQGLEVSSDVQALMRQFFQDDQDALNMAVMASTVPISAMGPNAMGFTGDRTAILPHAIGPDKPWAKRYLRKLILRGEGPTFADDTWWLYSDHPIRVARGWRYELRRLSWRAAKALARAIG